MFAESSAEYNNFSQDILTRSIILHKSFNLATKYFTLKPSDSDYGECLYSSVPSFFPFLTPQTFQFFLHSCERKSEMVSEQNYALFFIHCHITQEFDDRIDDHIRHLSVLLKNIFLCPSPVAISSKLFHLFMFVHKLPYFSK